MSRLRPRPRLAAPDEELTSVSRDAYNSTARFSVAHIFPGSLRGLNDGEARSGFRCSQDCRGLVVRRLWSSRRETDLSTEQDRSQAASWLPRAHGDSRRPQGTERPARPRPEAPFSLTISAGSAPLPPPRSSGPRALDETPGRAEAGSGKWGRLTRRAEFQRTARGRRAKLEAFTLQANRRPEPTAVVGPRVGFTVTKKVGNSVVRNRIRRRLREALRHISCLEALPDHDYVVLARNAALTMGFEALVGELDRSFRQIRRERPRSEPGGQR